MLHISIDGANIVTERMVTFAVGEQEHKFRTKVLLDSSCINLKNDQSF